MFRKSIISTLAVAVLATAAIGTTSASAGGYGYNKYGYHKNSYYGGYKKRHFSPSVSNHNWQRHVSWCYDRFKSYRASDNTWLPHYNSSRRKCHSPYYAG